LLPKGKEAGGQAKGKSANLIEYSIGQKLIKRPEEVKALQRPGGLRIFLILLEYSRRFEEWRGGAIGKS
jgi:hypothetical protein